MRMMGFLVCSTIFDITITEHLLSISLCLLGVISVLIKLIAERESRRNTDKYVRAIDKQKIKLMWDISEFLNSYLFCAI